MSQHAYYGMPGARTATAQLGRRVAATIRAVWEAIRRERLLKATIQTLHALDDRTLSDIGIERADIEAAVRGRRRAGE